MRPASRMPKQTEGPPAPSFNEDARNSPALVEWWAFVRGVRHVTTGIDRHAQAAVEGRAL